MEAPQGRRTVFAPCFGRTAPAGGSTVLEARDPRPAQDRSGALPARPVAEVVADHRRRRSDRDHPPNAATHPRRAPPRRSVRFRPGSGTPATRRHDQAEEEREPVGLDQVPAAVLSLRTPAPAHFRSGHPQGDRRGRAAGRARAGRRVKRARRRRIRGRSRARRRRGRVASPTRHTRRRAPRRRRRVAGADARKVEAERRRGARSCARARC